ncbi:MAG: uracil-DNA glycosylase [Pseudomonadota bacterium]
MRPGAFPPGSEPDRDCPRCPRLAAYRAANRTRYPAWHNAPVRSFGEMSARLLVVGLGPGLKGANRTGRPFTGDYAGDLLYATLVKFALASGAYAGGRDDGPWPGDALRLIDTRVTNALRCVPPENKPLAHEVAGCRPFLVAEIAAMPRLRAILALGRIAHEAALAALGCARGAHAFAHGAIHALPSGTLLADSYHCSRYNTNTGRLTPAMFEAVVANLLRALERGCLSLGPS